MLGMPRRLVFGYLALAIFMAGDGFELTFLSRYLVQQHGFSPQQAGLAFTVYGFVVALSAWSTGVLAELYGAKRLMILGGVLWMGIHALLLTVGLQSPVLTIIVYGVRGLAYPLFMYSFLVLITQTVNPARLASATGWFWAAFSIGLGSLGAFIPSLTVPAIGEYATLWMSIVFVLVGTLIALFLVPGGATQTSKDLDKAGQTRELLRGVTILIENRQILLAVIIRVLCNLTLYGFPMLMPLYLTTREIGGEVFGYLALAIFMAGDGFELTFLSRYLVQQHGFSPQQAGLAFTVYGFVVALSAWSTGVLAELYGAKRLMILGGVLWMGIHALLLTVGLQSPVLTIIVYGVRGLAYPLFMYSFLVLITQTVNPARLASATGWFWAAFSIGLGSLGAFIPSLTVPAIGEYATLWMSIVFVLVGTLIALFLVPGGATQTSKDLDKAGQTRELLRGVTILIENRQILLAVIIRVLCNLTLYGFPMLMPLYLTTREIGGEEWFSQTEWMTIWGIMNTITIGTNVVWGILGDRFGWMRQMRWFGFLGMALATLMFAFLPRWTDGSYAAMVLAAVVFALSVTAFVPMAAIFPALAPEHRGAAVSANNLASGLTTFLGPGIATVFLPLLGPVGVCILYAALMVLGTVITFFIHPPQPGITDRHRPAATPAEKEPVGV